MRKSYYLLVFVVTAFTLAFSGGDQAIAQQQDPAKDFLAWQGKLLFPSNTLEPDDPDYWLNANRFYSYVLTGLDEQSLFDMALDESETIIRLSIFPSFASPISAKIISDNDQYYLVYKTGNVGGWGPVTEFNETRTELTQKQFDHVLNLVENASLCLQAYNTRRGFDGTTWILELKDASRYCAYKEWQPEQGVFLDVFQFAHEAQGINSSNVDLR